MACWYNGIHVDYGKCWLMHYTRTFSSPSSKCLGTKLSHPQLPTPTPLNACKTDSNDSVFLEYSMTNLIAPFLSWRTTYKNAYTVVPRPFSQGLDHKAIDFNLVATLKQASKWGEWNPGLLSFSESLPFIFTFSHCQPAIKKDNYRNFLSNFVTYYLLATCW